MSRMKILNAVEQEQFESPPVFNSVQRKQYFDFSLELLTLARDLQTPTNQVCFLAINAQPLEKVKLATLPDSYSSAQS